MKRLVAAAEAGAGLAEHLDAERTAIVDLAGDAFATAAIARMIRP